MIDFTLNTYTHFMKRLSASGYVYQSVQDYILKPAAKSVIIRHDVDILGCTALRLARIERDIGISSTYYFRAFKKRGFQLKFIRQVADLGHEIGYHYEDLSRCNGDMNEAIKSFENNLGQLRKIYPVKTICMHGSSGSRYDNRDLWIKYDYTEYGLIAEPYLDLDFNRVLYLSDVARRWNGRNIAIRDKVNSGYSFSFITTFDIFENLSSLPDHILITTHPELWPANIYEILIVSLYVRIHTAYKLLYRNRKVLKEINQNKFESD